jgi:acetolactate synthase-1/2/3 large subunit
MAAPIVIVVNNGSYGTIRMNQESDYPDRVIGSELINPDFAALARAYRTHGETVARTEDFAPALSRVVVLETGGQASWLCRWYHPDIGVLPSAHVLVPAMRASPSRQS